MAQNWTEAVKLYTKAADQGMIQATHNLGLSYARGEGAAQSWPEAARLWGLAAAAGKPESMHNLAHCYSDGKGVVRDRGESTRLYRLAAAQGYGLSQTELDRILKDPAAFEAGPDRSTFWSEPGV